MISVRFWRGTSEIVVRGKLIRYTDKGVIIEDRQGRRFYAFNHNIVNGNDLFGEIR